MYECSKAVARRLRDPGFLQRYFVGVGLDVGSGPDPLGRYAALFPRLAAVEPWDVAQGDATLLQGVPDAKYDFVHSSHCLEHLYDPRVALVNWMRVTKPLGHVIVLIPDYELYEHRHWPSRYNPDHKHAFWPGVGERGPYTVVSPLLNPLTLLTALPPKIGLLVKLERLESTFLEREPDTTDQTLNPVSECAIEFVIRKL